MHEDRMLHAMELYEYRHILEYQMQLCIVLNINYKFLQ